MTSETELYSPFLMTLLMASSSCGVRVMFKSVLRESSY